MGYQRQTRAWNEYLKALEKDKTHVQAAQRAFKALGLKLNPSGIRTLAQVCRQALLQAVENLRAANQTRDLTQIAHHGAILEDTKAIVRKLKAYRKGE